MIDVTWPQLKQIILSSGLNSQWFADDNAYIVFDNSLNFRAVIPFLTPESPYQVDFETNFKNSSASIINSYVTITGNSTTTAKSGAGILHAIIVGNNTTGGTVTIYDNTTGSGTVIMTLSLGTPSGGLLSTSGQLGPVYLNTLNIKFSTGLTIVTTGSSNNNVTIIYQ